jgi:hypothetical protein
LSRILESEKEERKEQNNSLVSEYKIGYTTYIVELHFNFDCGETLDDVVGRLMLKDAGIA